MMEHISDFINLYKKVINVDEIKEWLKELSIGDELPVRDYGYRETARLARKCLALLRKQEEEIKDLRPKAWAWEEHSSGYNR